MNSAQPNRPAGAFTLVEMLVVIAIIALLAALLLPALSASQMRAKRIACESQLRQLGIAFQTFAHDHDGKFPMQVAASDGGSQEFVQRGYLANGPFYFGFRHFQPLAGIPQTPAILICPADTRLAATNFTALQNSNVSYFIGVTAQYSQPMSILCGDGNLAAVLTLVRGAAGGRLTWTAEQHRLKGNVLFADGHVEEWSDGSANTLANGGNFVLPTVAGEGNPASPFAPASVSTMNAISVAPTNSGTARPNATTNEPGHPLTNQPEFFPAPAAGAHSTKTVVSEPSSMPVSNPAAGSVLATPNAPAVGIPHPADSDSMMSPFNRQVAKFLRDVIVGTYLLFLLLVLLFAAYRIWRWAHSPQRQRRRQPVEVDFE